MILQAGDTRLSAMGANLKIYRSTVDRPGGENKLQPNLNQQMPH